MKMKEINFDKLTVDVAITNRCNARCPQCHRTDINGLGEVEWLPIISWSIEEFKKMFPVHALDDVIEYSFCGTWGDSMMAKDIEKICHYIMDNSKAKIVITTNGSIRNEEFHHGRYRHSLDIVTKRVTKSFNIGAEANVRLRTPRRSP